jgi:hypothetical protein
LENLEKFAFEQGHLKFEPRRLAPTHDVARARPCWSRHRPTGHERRYPVVISGPKASHRRSHRNPRRHASHLLRPSRPTSPPPNQWPHRHTSPALPRTSPYAHHAAPGLPLAVMLRTTLVPYRDPLPKARAPIKGVELAATRIGPGTEPPSAIGAATVNSTLRPLATPTRAAPAFLFYQQRSHTRLLARPGRAACSPE